MSFGLAAKKAISLSGSKTLLLLLIVKKTENKISISYGRNKAVCTGRRRENDVCD